MEWWRGPAARATVALNEGLQVLCIDSADNVVPANTTHVGCEMRHCVSLHMKDLRLALVVLDV